MRLNKHKILLAAGIALSGVTIYSCSKSFLERPPYGVINRDQLTNRVGVEGMLVAAYSMLDGAGVDDWMLDSHNTSVWNAWAGSVAADDAHKGGANSSQVPRAQLEGKTYAANNDIIQQRYRFYYNANYRANEVLRLLALTDPTAFTDAEKGQIIAEVRFLRAHYLFEAAKMFNNVPYVDETVTLANNNFKVPNTQDPNVYPEIWAKIEADAQFAADNLDAIKAQVGRAHKWAAKALLAKIYMQQAKLDEAKPILNDIILNGANARGDKFELQPTFKELFSPEGKNGTEAVFSVQMSVKDGSFGNNGNNGEAFNIPPFLGGTTNGWGHQPSFNLVNAYKTDGGLPMLDDFNEEAVKNEYDESTPTPFVPDTRDFDPRLDWTVGRKGIPYQDYGLVTVANNVGGPYWGKKWVPFKGNNNDFEVVDSWKMHSAINYPMIRYADILLMAAECEVDGAGGDLSKAEDYVNMVRTRAANPDGFLKKYINDLTPGAGFSDDDAASYVINPYPDGSFSSKDFARKAVRFERRLEFATEGHRFFDLQRFDRIDKKYGNADHYMADLMNKYVTEEVEYYHSINKIYDVLEGTSFTADKHEIYALPQDEIDKTSTVVGNTKTIILKQNPNH